MGRNIVICCDGTNDQFGPENTNVVRLAQVLDRDPTKQRLYYDPGVGTLAEPGVVTAIGKRMSEIVGLAFGAGLTWKVQEAYIYLMDFWEPGDRVFVFGFSRGAYTARVLAALLHAMGVLPRGNYNLVPYVIRLFKAVGREHHSELGANLTEYTKLCDHFRWSFARVVSANDDERRFPVHFLGLWDTVSSVGWVWDPPRFPYTAHNPSVRVIRHAVAIDERRWFFRQNRIFQAEAGQDLKEVWFAGVHSDIGGGYPEADGGLWRVPFEWMLGEATRAGLLVDTARLSAVRTQSAASAHPYDDAQHESLTTAWWPAEFFPKWQWLPVERRRRIAVGLGRHRAIQDGALIHRSVVERLKETPYRPRNLSDAFVAESTNLSVIPEVMPYSATGSIIAPA